MGVDFELVAFFRPTPYPAEECEPNANLYLRVACLVSDYVSYEHTTEFFQTTILRTPTATSRRDRKCCTPNVPGMPIDAGAPGR